MALWIKSGQSGIESLQEGVRDSLLGHYNDITHGGLIIVLLILAGILIQAILQSPSEDLKTKHQKSWLSKSLGFIKEYPVVTIILAAYMTLMIQESSWFYKEILTWYDDIFSDHLLNNFSLRQSFISETMGRNDFRFYPLSHQDLHILSWFTPYTKVWSIVSAIELVVTVILGCRVVQILNKEKSSKSIYLMGTLLFLFTSATAYNYFQFIYSERFLTFLLALYIYEYTLYQRTGNLKRGRAALFYALFIPFFKDTAILLAAAPAAATILLGSLGKITNYPKWDRNKLKNWLRSYSLEIAICSLIPFFASTFLFLSAIPSSVANVQRYDSHLAFSVLALDTRLILFLGFILVRMWLIFRNRSKANTLDMLNLSALSYGLALYALVGLEGENYMTLPIQFTAVLDILMIWEILVKTWLKKIKSTRILQSIAVGTTLLILNIEDRQAYSFRQRVEYITNKQRAWRKTYNRAAKISKKAKENGEQINLIYSKGWFKNSNEMKKLTYDRLVYYDIDTRRYSVKDGIGKGLEYIPRKGDYLIDIDSGKRLSRYGIDLSNYEAIYEAQPGRQYSRIFRHL